MNAKAQSSRQQVPLGTRSIARAVNLLKAISARKNIGWRLTDLASHCNLDDSTVHRIMVCLANLEMAQQRRNDRRWVPGPLLYELALSLPRYFSFQENCRQNLIRLAKRSGWVAYLFLRSGLHSVCVDRWGRTTVHLIVEPGMRRPLAGSATGIAMLLMLSKKEQRAIRTLNRQELLAIVSHRKRAYDKMWEQSQREGVGIALGDVVQGVASIGVPILDAKKRPFGALGLSGPMNDFSLDKLERFVKIMRSEARAIQHESYGLINS